MVKESVIESVKRYLVVLSEMGIHASWAVLFGSVVRGMADEYSDIDLIIIAPEFDGERNVLLIKKLWRARVIDDRIEPIPCGEKEWESEHGRPILEIARREGVIIAA